MKRTLATLLFGVIVAGGGCYSDEYTSHPAYAARPVTVAVAPPAPIDEVPPPQPYIGAAWLSGYWDWRADRDKFVWVAGHWGFPPHTGLALMRTCKA